MLVFRLHALTFGLVCLATLGCDSGGRENVQNITVVSPSGELELAVATDDAGQLTYTVTIWSST